MVLAGGTAARMDGVDKASLAVDGMTLLKRMAWVVDDGVITTVFYPVFPPDRNAADVIDWLFGP